MGPGVSRGEPLDTKRYRVHMIHVSKTWEIMIQGHIKIVSDTPNTQKQQSQSATYSKVSNRSTFVFSGHNVVAFYIILHFLSPWMTSSFQGLRRWSWYTVLFQWGIFFWPNTSLFDRIFTPFTVNTFPLWTGRSFSLSSICQTLLAGDSLSGSGKLLI